MYPTRMDPLMIELCNFHEMLWRKDHPEHDFYAAEIAIAFLQSADERGLARCRPHGAGERFTARTTTRNVAGRSACRRRGRRQAAESCLALDPNSSRAKELRARIADAKARERA